MPKLTSIPTTLDLALTGKNVKADKAKKLGIVDLLVSPLGPGMCTTIKFSFYKTFNWFINSCENIKIKFYIWFIFFKEFNNIVIILF